MLLQDVVVVVLQGSDSSGVRGRRDDAVGAVAAAHDPAELVLLVEAAVLAEQLIVLERILVTGDEVFVAVGAPEAVHVEDLVLGPHDIVVLAEAADALVTLGPKQSAGIERKKERKKHVVLESTKIYVYMSSST